LCLTLSKIFRFFKHAVKRHKIWGYVQRAVTLGGGCPA
jgi:hypothetical protein